MKEDLYRHIIENTPEALRYKWHCDNMLKKMNPRGLTDAILFAYADKIDGLKSMYPPKGVDADVSTNLPMVYKESEFYKDINEFIELGIKHTFPIGSYKIKNGFLNIKYPDRMINYSVLSINASQL